MRFLLITAMCFLLTGCFVDFTLSMNKGHAGTQPPPPPLVDEKPHQEKH